MKRNPITARCDRSFMPAYRQSGLRLPQQITHIVLHDTESPAGSAASIAHYFQSHSAGGSAHLVVDDEHCYRCLADAVIPWGAPPLNDEGLHIEHCGYARWPRKGWMMHIRMLRRSAWKSARWCRRYHIPAAFVTAEGLKRGARGITTHAEVSKAYGQSDHTDPGAGFPKFLYVMLVRYYIHVRRAS